MRAVDIARLIAPVLGVVAAVVLGARRQMFRRLRAAGATGPASAQPIEATGLAGFWRRKLLAAGVLRPADGDRCWLDVERWRAYQDRRKRRALTIVAIAGAAALATVAYAAWRAKSGQ